MTEARSEGRSRPERLVFMRRHLRLLGLPRLGLALGLLALLASAVKADLSVNGLGLSDGAKDHHKRVTTESTEEHGKGKLIWILFSVYFGGFRG